MNKYELHLGDCLEVMKEIPDNSVDMILCDLPYGTTACKWDVIIPFDKLWEQYFRITNKNSAIVLTASQPFTSHLILSQTKYFKYELIWQKDKPSNFALANKQPMKYHENICVFYKEQPIFNKQLELRTGKGEERMSYDVNHKNRKLQGQDKEYSSGIANYGKLKNPSSVQYFDTGRRQHLIHPTQKPVALMEYLIKTYTNEGQTVLDNCMGSGTTGVACVNTNRNFIGIEKDETYFYLAKERIESS